MYVSQSTFGECVQLVSAWSVSPDWIHFSSLYTLLSHLTVAGAIGLENKLL